MHISGEAMKQTLDTRRGMPGIDDDAVVALAETFRILGDATRVRMLNALSRSELCVQDLARAVDLSESAVSHQLRLLRGMRLVRPRRAGRQIFYSLDDQHIVRLFEQGLAHVKENPHRPPRRLTADARPTADAVPAAGGSPATGDADVERRPARTGRDEGLDA